MPCQATCSRCCPQPVDEAPVAPIPEWLQPVDHEFFRPRDFLQVQVLHRQHGEYRDDEIHRRFQLEACWEFRGVHGTAELVAALQQARRMHEGLADHLVKLLEGLTQ